MTGQIRALPSTKNGRAARIARLIQRAVIRTHLSTPEGRRALTSIADEIDVEGALTLVEEVRTAPSEERKVILTQLSLRPEEVLRNAALRALAA